MKTSRFLKPELYRPWLFTIMCFLFSMTAWAQEPAASPSQELRDDFSDDELKSFVKASKKITSIQMETEQKMIRSIEDEGLTVERFHQILEQQRNPQNRTETSPEELKSFNNAAQNIIAENKKVEQQMAASIEEEGIDVETYNQIMVAYQQNQEIQRKIDKYIDGEK